jgi:hypothetical protein
MAHGREKTHFRENILIITATSRAAGASIGSFIFMIAGTVILNTGPAADWLLLQMLCRVPQSPPTLFLKGFVFLEEQPVPQGVQENG